MRHIIDDNMRMVQLLTHQLYGARLYGPQRERATVRHRLFESASCADHIDLRPEGPRLSGLTLIKRQGMGYLECADDRAMRQVGLVGHALHACDQRKLRCIRRRFGPCVQRVPPRVHSEVPVLHALISIQDGPAQLTTTQREAMSDQPWVRRSLRTCGPRKYRSELCEGHFRTASRRARTALYVAVIAVCCVCLSDRRRHR